INLVEALTAYLDSEDAVVPRDLIYPEGRSVKEATELTHMQMVSSKETSEAAALRLAGYPVTSTVEVVDVDGDGPAAGSVRPGDVIVAVDGEQVDTARAAAKAVGNLDP